MKYKVTLNGKVYEVSVEEGEAILENEAVLAETPAVNASTVPAAASDLKFETASQSGGDPLLCPMPGVIVALKKEAGDRVKKGEVVLILEAMKMENEISAHMDGEICAIHIAKGASVDVGAKLFSIK